MLPISSTLSTSSSFSSTLISLQICFWISFWGKILSHTLSLFCFIFSFPHSRENFFENFSHRFSTSRLWLGQFTLVTNHSGSSSQYHQGHLGKQQSPLFHLYFSAASDSVYHFLLRGAFSSLGFRNIMFSWLSYYLTAFHGYSSDVLHGFISVLAYSGALCPSCFSVCVLSCLRRQR